MRIQKIIGITIMCIAISALAVAQPPDGGAAPGGGMPGGTGGPGGAPQGDQVSATLDMTPVYEAMDTNKDGLVNKDEWLGSGMTQDSYDRLFCEMLDTDKDGNLTKDDIMKAIPRFEVDTDGDGKASIEEFAEANKQAAANMAGGGQGGGAPGGGAPQGGPPAGAPPGDSQMKIEGAYETVLNFPKASPTVVLVFCPNGEPFSGVWVEDGGEKLVDEMYDKSISGNELSFTAQAGPGVWEFKCTIDGKTIKGTVTGDGATSPFEGSRIELDKDFCEQ